MSLHVLTHALKRFQFIMPLPFGLLAQIAADAAAAGDCAARITLTLGRAGETGCAGSLLAVVREGAAGGVVLELFSDARTCPRYGYRGLHAPC
jgi:hypothetical protein